MACLGAAAATDGGCPVAKPVVQETCGCNPNPTITMFAGCIGMIPKYFDDLNDFPNGACVATVNGKKESTSTTTCLVGNDCLPGLHCNEGFCVDDNGVRESDRVVTTCVSPKTYDAKDDRSGCGYGDQDNKLRCHKYWISPLAMGWKRYLQHNALGRGDLYSWAYDEMVCATSDHTRSSENEACTDRNSKGGAVDTSGNVIETTCPCTVENSVKILTGEPWKEHGYGDHMYLHIYDIMFPGYVKPTKRNNFTPIVIPRVAAEDSDFYLKIVNQYSEEILLYLDVPPSRKNEHASGDGTDVGQMWGSWTGSTKTLRGSIQQAQENVKNGDAWVPRITIAPNDNPSAFSQPAMRVTSKGEKTGGFYVPKDHHLRIHVADQQANGAWCKTNTDRNLPKTPYCPDTTCFCPGVNMWLTRADAYTTTDRDTLLLFEPNFNDPFLENPVPNAAIYFDISGVDGINANVELRYGKIDNSVQVPLFESKDGLLSAEPDFNTDSLTSLQ